MDPTRALGIDQTPRSLRDDRRGAIVVMAVFMATFMVGCLWYIIGIGEAAIYRQKMDAGADAVAFSAAVYHARGMNMIAMLNLILAATLALVVVAKALKFIIGIVYATAKMMCLFAGGYDPGVTDPSCAIAKEAGEKMIKLNTIIDAVEGNGDKLLASLSDAQREIAVVAPWVASTESTNARADYAPIVVGGAAVSPSMIPKGQRLGLPVMDEDFAKTCNRAGDIVPDMIVTLVPATFLAYLELDLGALAETFSPKYCGEGTWSGDDFEFFDEEDVCRDKEKAYKKKWKEEHGGTPWKPGDPPFNYDQCIDEAEEEKETKEDATEDDEDIPKVDPTQGLEGVDKPESKTAKMVYPPAQNGDDYFQVYAIVEGDTTRLYRPDKGVLIAAGSKAPTIAKDSTEKAGLGQAEFYYDQTPKAVGEDRCWNGGCGLTWDSYKENTLWNMRWRARLRFPRAPGPGVDVDILSDGLPSTAPPEVAGTYIPDALGTVNDAILKGMPKLIYDTRIKLLGKLTGG